MPGRRLSDDERAVHGPSEDRAVHGPTEDRAGKRRGTRRRKGARPDPETEGMSEKDAARLRAYREAK